jgi:hypothetical protein
VTFYAKRFVKSPARFLVRDLHDEQKAVHSAVVVIQAVNAGSFERANFRGNAQQRP